MSLYNYTAAAVKINPIGTGISTGSAIFPVSADNCSGATLSAGKSCSFTVSFAPSGTGPQSATLTVGSGLATNPTAALSGTGVANGLTLNTAAVAFGNVGENTTKLYTVTVYNYTANAVTVTGVAPTMPGVTLGTDNCTGKSVAVNASCTVALNFMPTNLGPQSGTLTISSALATNPSATLSGTGVAAALTLNATTVNFGSAGVGSSKASVMSLYNYTAAAVPITAISTGSAIFPVTVDGCSGTTLGVGKSCSFTVSFAPSTTGLQSGTLTVTSTTSPNPSATLSGTGVVNGLTLNTTAVAFGNVGEKWSGVDLVVELKRGSVSPPVCRKAAISTPPGVIEPEFAGGGLAILGKSLP
jgi:hypothetical protein